MRGSQYGRTDDPPGPAERSDRSGDLTDRELENRLTRLESSIGNWRWIIGVGVSAASAAVGGAAVATRLIES